jgi:hypothetical protein
MVQRFGVMRTGETVKFETNNKKAGQPAANKKTHPELIGWSFKIIPNDLRFHIISLVAAFICIFVPGFGYNLTRSVILDKRAVRGICECFHLDVDTVDGLFQSRHGTVGGLRAKSEGRALGRRASEKGQIRPTSQNDEEGSNVREYFGALGGVISQATNGATSYDLWRRRRRVRIKYSGMYA